ncbi:MAG TPA: hypothetical protein VKT18_06790, partial [Acidimicrobiales bacterium]|nr:hypothetical protein [Acidimicrobiales bacterium]
TGEEVDDERLLLYRLVQLWDRQRQQALAPDQAERLMACALQDWARARLLGRSLDGADGPWCVLDVDGTLESSRLLGAPTVTPSGADALRALRAHGYRTVLATGRSVGEVRDRCVRFGLHGGVAEYGSALYVRATDAVHELVDDDQRGALASARERLGREGGVVLADGFASSVRAYVVTASGRRRALPAGLVDEVRRAAHGRLWAIQGVAQTDLVPFGVDKGRGVLALLELLDGPGVRPVLCVGDSEPDLAMLRLAPRARVPANAATLAGAGVVATRRVAQRGLAEAVDGLVGHGTAPCATCTPRPLGTPATALVVAALEGLEAGRRTSLAALPGLWRAARAVRAAPPRTVTRPPAPLEPVEPAPLGADPLSESAPPAGRGGSHRGRRTRRDRSRARSVWRRGHAG